MRAGDESFTIEPSDAVHLQLAGKQIHAKIGENEITAASLSFSSRKGGAADLVMAVPGKIRRQFHGVLQIGVAHGDLQPVIAMDLELAVASSVAAESPPDAP